MDCCLRLCEWKKIMEDIRLVETIAQATRSEAPFHNLVEQAIIVSSKGMYARELVFLLSCFCITSVSSFVPAAPLTSSARSMGGGSELSAAVALADYTGAAASLFNNMKTPASILAGAIVGLGFGGPLPEVPDKERKNNKLERMMRKSYLFVAAIALLSQLAAIMHATIAVNQLTEDASIGKTSSVWELLETKFDLSWSGTNAHFVLGMLAYSYIIGVRSYFLAGRGLMGQGVGAIAASALLFMLGIVNRGVASASGDGEHGYGSTVMALFRRYIILMARKNFRFSTMRPLEILSFGLLIFATVQAGRAIFKSASNDTTE